VLSRHTFKISRKKGSDFVDHRGTLIFQQYLMIHTFEAKPRKVFERVFTSTDMREKEIAWEQGSLFLYKNTSIYVHSVYMCLH